MGGGFEGQATGRGGVAGGAYFAYKKHFFGAQIFGELWASAGLYGTVDSGGILSTRVILSSGGMYGARAALGFAGLVAEYSVSKNFGSKNFGPWEIADFGGIF